MIDALSGAGGNSWALATRTQTAPPPSDRPAISIYQAPSQRPLAGEGSTFATDRLIASLQSLALRARAKEIVDGETAAPTAAATPLVTSMSTRAQVSASAS